MGVGRRTMVMVAATAWATAATAVRAEEDDPWAGSYVKPALPLDAYLQQLERSRGEAFASMQRSIEQADYRSLSNNLVLAPFDDVRQALFFIPW